MLHSHMGNGANFVQIYERRYLGQGRYYQRGHCQNISVGDDFESFTTKGVTLKVDKIMEVYDAKGLFKDESNRVKAIYEAEMVDPYYKEGNGFVYNPLNRI